MTDHTPPADLDEAGMETRHYIGVTPIGRLHMTIGPAHPDTFRDPAGELVPPTQPLPTANGAGWVYPVSAEIAAEWDLDDDEDECPGPVDGHGCDQCRSDAELHHDQVVL